MEKYNNLKRRKDHNGGAGPGIRTARLEEIHADLRVYMRAREPITRKGEMVPGSK